MSCLPIFVFLFAGNPDAITAGAIMSRVAENQERAMQLRSQYVYQQRVNVTTRLKNGRLARQETAEYLVIPSPAGIAKNLQKIDGKYCAEKAQVIDFHGEPAPKSDSLDGELIRDFRNDFLNNDTKDGLAGGLFPFTAKEQKQYEFELAGEQVVDGRKAYRIRFRPAEKHDFNWAGEALIDQEEFQPVRVSTRLSRRIPMAVRTLLGTDLPGLGFSVRYQRLEKDVWFPVSFGTEFRLHVLFFLNRNISVSSDSSGFRRASVDSTIQFATPR